MEELQKKFGSSAPLKWYHKPKKQFQVEVPVALLKKKPADKDFELVSQTKVAELAVLSVVIIIVIIINNNNYK